MLAEKVLSLRRFAVLALLSFAVDAFAYPVTWTLSGATFSDGGTAAGSFVYDADTHTLSSWSVAVAGGDTATFPPFTYDTSSSSGVYDYNNPTIIGTELQQNGTLRQLRMPGTSALSNAGGTVPINLASPAQAECYNCGPFRTFTAGNLVGTAAPAITSAASAYFVQGSPGSFTVTATGAPVPSLSETGTLPSGVTFVDNGDGTATLAGTAAATGIYPITITAANGMAPDATQNFVLSVQAAPVVTAAPGLTNGGMAALLLALLAFGAGALRRRAARAR